MLWTKFTVKHKKYIKLSIQFIEHTIFNISKEKKSTMFRKKSHFFLTREKSHILGYIFFRDLGMTFRDLRFKLGILIFGSGTKVTIFYFYFNPCDILNKII